MKKEQSSENSKKNFMRKKPKTRIGSTTEYFLILLQLILQLKDFSRVSKQQKTRDPDFGVKFVQHFIVNFKYLL